jgi:hypothetical protein
VRSIKLQYSSSLRANTLIRAVTRELPNNYPFVVQKNYIVAFVEQWGDPAQALFTFTANKLKELTLQIVDDHFAAYTHGYLKQRVS